MKVLLIGSKGQLATSLRSALAGEDVVALSRAELDICDASAVDAVVRAVRPDVVINPAAIRRPDDCESAPERAFAVNAIGPRNLAISCRDIGAALVHISTDNVFDGRATSPYLEDDRPNPVNVYGISKLAGEQFVKAITDRHYIIRTSALFGGTQDRSRAANFVLTLLDGDAQGLEARVVTDQRISPTYTEDLARKIAWLIRRDEYGVCHITNAGDCTWYELAMAVFEKAGLRTGLVPITTEELARPACRLRYAVLGRGVLERLGTDDLPTWQDGLDRYLQSLGVRSPATVS